MSLFDDFKFKTRKRKLIRAKTNRKIVTIPGKFSEIGYEAFFNSKTEELYVKEGVTTLESGCFSKMNNLKLAFLPSSITSIGVNVFKDDKQLETVILPMGLNSLGIGMFSNCSNLTNVSLPYSLKCIEDRTFYKCSNLKNLVIDGSIMDIGSNAFTGSGLTELDLETSKVQKISHQAFAECNMLEKVITSRRLVDIDDQAFLRTSNLSYLKLNEGLVRIGHSAFKSSGIWNLVIPNTVSCIEDEAFADCGKLTDLVLSNKLRIIPNKCFMNCHALKKLVIPNSVEIIGDKAFYDCVSIKEITIPNKVKKIGNLAFANCLNLKKLVVEGNDLKLNGAVFTNCRNLEKIVYKNKEYNVRNLIIDEINQDFLTRLELQGEKLARVKCPISINSLNSLENVGLLEEFYKEAFYDNYRTIYKEIFGVNKFYSLSQDKLFLLCYTMGIFTKRKTLRASRLIKECIDEGLIDKYNLENLINNLEFSSLDIDMINVLTSKNTTVFKDAIKHCKIEKAFLSKLFKEYQTIIQTSVKDKENLLFSEVLDYFNSKKFKGIESKRDINLAKEIGKFYSEQKVFDDAKKVMDEHYQSGIKQSLVSESVRKEQYEKIDLSRKKILATIAKQKFEQIIKEIYYEFLKKDDPKNLTIGKYCDLSCTYSGEGEKLSTTSVLNPLTQTIVMNNKFDEIISYATFTINKESNAIVVCDLKLNKSLVFDNEEMVAKKYLEAFNNFIKDYNENNLDKINKIYLSSINSSLTEYFAKPEDSQYEIIKK